VNAALRVEGLAKGYRKPWSLRRAAALDGLEFEVPEGTICGLIGPNGAGKTTAMSIVAGFVKPDAGRVDLLGRGPFDPGRHRGRVGILPQDAELPTASTPRQLLSIWARLQGIRGPAVREAVARALSDVLLDDRADARIGTLSHGMRRRVTVASALLGDPAFVLLDEPTSGLDPAQARHLRERIAVERGRRTVLVSSHNLAELESLCDHVVFIDHGRCTGSGSMATITGRDRQVTIRLAAPFPPGRSETVVITVEPGRRVEEATSEVLRELLAEGALISEVRQGDSLERRFLAAASPSGAA
jgi:ABC-type multidrug transport system ATPase subunit